MHTESISFAAGNSFPTGRRNDSGASGNSLKRPKGPTRLENRQTPLSSTMNIVHSLRQSQGPATKQTYHQRPYHGKRYDATWATVWLPAHRHVGLNFTPTSPLLSGRIEFERNRDLVR